MKVLTIVVGPDGDLFDISLGEYPPKTRDNKNYVPAFGQDVSEDVLKGLKKMSKKELMRHYGMKK